MLGVVRQEESLDLLRYQPLPDEFEYTIDSSTVTVTYPSVANLLETPTVTAGQALVDRNGNVVTFSRQNVEENETLVFDMTFAKGSLISAPPGWQARRAEQDAFAPMWIGASIFILAIGSFGAWWVYRNHQPTTHKGTAVLYEPPNDLPPAIAGVLNGHGAKPAWSNALATLFDLAERGILSIEEVQDKKWYQGQDFAIVQQDLAPKGLLAHEQGLLDLLFETKKGRETAVKMSKLTGMVTGKQWKKFTDPLEAELKAAGYIDPARKSRRQWVMGGSLIFLILGAAAMIGLPIGLVRQFGAWPVSVGIALFLLFVVWMTTGNVLTILTDEAKLMADQWQSFHNYMKDVTRKKAAVGNTNMFNQFLPYAASYGLLHQWAKFFEKEGWTEVPSYFHAASRTGSEHMAAFVAMTGSSASSGGAAAGAGGAAGAAGGGASGAG